MQYQKHFLKSILEESRKKREVKVYLQIQLNQIVPIQSSPIQSHYRRSRRSQSTQYLVHLEWLITAIDKKEDRNDKEKVLFYLWILLSTHMKTRLST